MSGDRQWYDTFATYILIAYESRYLLSLKFLSALFLFFGLKKLQQQKFLKDLKSNFSL